MQGSGFGLGAALLGLQQVLSHELGGPWEGPEGSTSSCCLLVSQYVCPCARLKWPIFSSLGSRDTGGPCWEPDLAFLGAEWVR